MIKIVPFVLLFCLLKYEVNSLTLPGPRVYVVTPAPRTPQNDHGRPAPFYYRNWMKRMDTPGNATSTTTTTTQKTKTPDLIFAEFESGHNNVKSLRNLLQKEKIYTTTTTTTTSRPIYVPEEETYEPNYGLPVATTTEKPKKTDMTDYFALYNNLYNSGPLLSPVYSPSSGSSTSPPTTTTLPTTMQTPLNNVENIWHIIDSEKNDQNHGMWEEEPISLGPSPTTTETESEADEVTTNESNGDDDGVIDENFAIPGFGTNPGNGAENESRAIRTEPKFRFPYVNLKPFQMKSNKNPILNSFSSGSKQGQNMFTNLDNFHDLKNPVRGEAQDVVVPMRQPIDRYNPAQPYLPQQPYGPKPKQSSPGNSPPSPPPPPPMQSTPVRTIANLVPPPLPPAPKLTADDFPTPSSYESFPPYAPAAPAPKPISSVSMFQPPIESGLDSSENSAPDSPLDDNGGPTMDLGYRYKPPSPPVPQFYPTLPPPSKPFSGYSYNKPTMSGDSPPPMMDMGSKPDFQGYHYSRPEPSAPPQDHPPVSYGHLDAPPPSYQPDYPDLIFDKPHGGAGGMKGGHDVKDSMGMKPPPAPSADDMKPDMDPHTAPGDDSGFPHDFPGDFKFHHDFEDHDYHHHHHHTTTTTTTEMPRVNRYSYYYLGKKLYYLPLYFSVYFIIYVGALIIKAVLRHKITYPNSWRPNDQTASFFSKRSIDSHLSKDNLHEITGRVTRAIAVAAEKYMEEKNKEQ